MAILERPPVPRYISVSWIYLKRNVKHFESWDFQGHFSLSSPSFPGRLLSESLPSASNPPSQLTNFSKQNHFCFSSFAKSSFALSTPKKIAGRELFMNPHAKSWQSKRKSERSKSEKDNDVARIDDTAVDVLVFECIWKVIYWCRCCNLGASHNKAAAEKSLQSKIGFRGLR